MLPASKQSLGRLIAAVGFLDEQIPRYRVGAGSAAATNGWGFPSPLLRDARVDVGLRSVGSGVLPWF